MPQIAPLKSITVGDFTVTFLPDGGGIVEPTALFPASETRENWQRYENLLNDDGQLVTSIGGYLVEVGNRKIIVDTGIGPVTIPFPGFGPFFGGEYLNNLRRTGTDRQDVTDVVFTHMHLDHVGWTTVATDDGQRELTFPNARHLVTRAEWEMWYGGDNPAGPHPEFVQQPLQGIIQYMEGDDEVVPGMTVISTPGHTAGHVSLRLGGNGQALYLTADVLHNAAQLTEPDWSVAFDADPVMARQSREALYPMLTHPDAIVAVNHFSDSVFGRMRRQDEHISWHPM